MLMSIKIEFGRREPKRILLYAEGGLNLQRHVGAVGFVAVHEDASVTDADLCVLLTEAARLCQAKADQLAPEPAPDGDVVVYGYDGTPWTVEDILRREG